MNLAYVTGAETVQYGELKPALVTGKGPTSYVQITATGGGDVVANPAAGDYVAYLDSCTTQSGNFVAQAIPTTAGQIRAGAPSPSASGWRIAWYNASGLTQVAAGTNLSAEIIQTLAIVTQL